MYVVYDKISKTLAFTFAFPPDGSASTSLQTKQEIFVEAFENIVCSFLHLSQRTFTNLALVCVIIPSPIF